MCNYNDDWVANHSHHPDNIDGYHNIWEAIKKAEVNKLAQQNPKTKKRLKKQPYCP